MDKVKRFLAMLLVALSLIVLTVPAFASTNDTEHTIPVASTFNQRGNARPKDSATACYLLIKRSPSTHVYVMAQGCSNTGAARANKTSYLAADGTYTNAPYVICRVNVKYSVHNQIYESGYRYAAYDFKTRNSTSGTLNYIWSPDSNGTYTSAT